MIRCTFAKTLFFFTVHLLTAHVRVPMFHAKGATVRIVTGEDKAISITAALCISDVLIIVIISCLINKKQFSHHIPFPAAGRPNATHPSCAFYLIANSVCEKRQGAPAVIK